MDELNRAEYTRPDVPPNPWFAQRIINNAALAERKLPFWAAFWRDVNQSVPMPKPAMALILILLIGFAVGMAATGETGTGATDISDSVLYETGGVL